MESIKCPKCNDSYYVELYSTSTAMYFEPIWKNGVNINPDNNYYTTRYRCMNCGNEFSIEHQYNHRELDSTDDLK